jgi:hypothetical protein
MHNLSASKSTGFCPAHASAMLEGMLELDRDGVGERKIILQLRSPTPSLLQRLRLIFGFNCGIRVQKKALDSGMRRNHENGNARRVAVIDFGDG